MVLVDYWWSGFGSVAGILVLVDYRLSGFCIGGVLVLVVKVVCWCW